MSEQPKLVTTWKVGHATHGVAADGTPYYHAGDGRWWELSIGREECEHMAALALAVKALAEALDKQHDADCAKYADKYQYIPWEETPCDCPVGPALALPVVREITGGEQ